VRDVKYSLIRIILQCAFRTDLQLSLARRCDYCWRPRVSEMRLI